MPEEKLPDIKKFLPAAFPAPPLPAVLVESMPDEVKLWKKLPKPGEK